MNIPAEYAPIVAGVSFAVVAGIVHWIGDWLWKRKMEREADRDEERKKWQTPD